MVTLKLANLVNFAPASTVMAYLLQRHLQSLPGVGISTIAAETKASVPTIYKALNTYAHCLEKDPEDKTLRLTRFGQKDWFHWIERTNRLSSVYFVNRSGAPRSSSRLGKDLARLGRDDLAIGGLMGAMHHLPEIDATAAPQPRSSTFCSTALHAAIFRSSNRSTRAWFGTKIPVILRMLSCISSIDRNPSSRAEVARIGGLYPIASLTCTRQD